MELLAQFIRTFLCGGVLCLIGQILIDKTSLTPAKILTMYVIAGVVLGAIGVYEPIAQWGGSGASVPLTGFGYNLAKGTMEAVDEYGILGALIGGVKSSAGGIAAAVVFGCCRRHHGRHLFRVADGAPFQPERKKMTKNSLYALK